MAYFEQTSVTNDDKVVINPSTEEAIILLRRLVKFFETQSATDTAQRQRITVDAITAGVALPTVTAVTAITNALPAGTNAIGAITNIALQFGWNQQMLADPARTAYNTGIRQRLTFT